MTTKTNKNDHRRMLRSPDSLSLCLRACRLAALLGSSIWTTCAPVHAAEDAPRLLLIEENDGIVTSDDRHYTQGAVWTWLSEEIEPQTFWNSTFDVIGVALPMFRHQLDTQRRIEWQVFGQSWFTPDDLDRSPPDPADRPYAGWAYTGIGWLQENHKRSLHSFEAQLGVVGPAALAEQFGNGFHKVFNFDSAKGWDYQIGNRGAFQFTYAFRHRLDLVGEETFGLDFVPSVGLSLGTVMRHAEAGGLIRMGNGRGADYGPPRVRPGLSGTTFADVRRLSGDRPSWYLFFGAQLRRVEHNVFIEASDEVTSPGVSSTPWVLDATGGIAAWVGSRLRMDFSIVHRSSEFDGQDRPDVFGAASLSLAL